MTIKQKQSPSSFISTLGTEPQVVTATVDLLLAEGGIIHEVIILHTTSPNSLIDQAVKTLQSTFDKPPYIEKFSANFHPLMDDQGLPLSDVASLADAQAAFRFLYRLLKKKKQDDYRIHLAISGGRKTLSLFALTAAQLLFDEDDRLWYLFSTGEFLTSKRMHPGPADQVTLVNIPVILWSKVSPVIAELRDVDDPFEAVKRVEELQLQEKYDAARIFILGSLTPAERRVVEVLARDGLSDQEIGERLYLSPRTVEQHLRSAYLKAAAHWQVENVTRAQLITLLQYFYSTQLRENPHDKRIEKV